MDTCYKHPDRPAVEHCELCRKPVCGSCLWYAESGERLCPEHALEFVDQGKPVQGPSRYASGILHSEASALTAKTAEAPYKGNSTDLGAVVAAVSGVMGLATCFGLSWLVPLVAFMLGLVMWFQAKDALDPRRTKWLAGVGMAGGGVFVVVIGAFFVLMFGVFAFAAFMASVNSGPSSFPTPTP